MRRPHLSTLLIALNVGLLLLGVTVGAVTAVRLLRVLADDQALARVAQAGASARSAVRFSSQEALADARLLSERPTLLRLLQAGDVPSLTAFLDRFREASQLDGCAIMHDGQIIARSGLALDWASIQAEGGAVQGAFLQAGLDEGPLVLGAWASLSAPPGDSVLVVIQLDEAYASRLTEEVGVGVRVLSLQAASAPGSLAGLRRQALGQGGTVTARLEDPGRYWAALPLSAPSGDVVGLVEAELPGAEAAASLRQLAQTLLLLALGTATLGAALSLWLGRRLTRPLEALTQAAARIGEGDLATPVRAAPGAEIGTLAATLEDMRRRLLQATTNLQRQQAESQAILAGVVEGVFAVDRQRHIRYLNPQAAAMLHLEVETALGQFCGDALQPEGPDGLRPCEEHCPILHARFLGGAQATEHLRLPNDLRRTVVITSAPPAEGQASDGEFRQIQVMRDETEVEATRRMRDAVLANISHEFRTPLSAQLASIELLLDQLPELSADQIGDLVRSLQRGTLRLTQLIDNLLEGVRLEAGQDAIRRQAFSLDEVVEQALELTRPLLDQRGQTIDVALPFPLPTLYGDTRRLTQVLVNLLANANKYAPPGSTIGIGGDVRTDQVAVWVEDEGPGLPDLPPESLFTRFVRSSTEEPEQGGVGLGLWIVKSIIERHGGRVTATSGPDRTRIAFSLPRQTGDEDPHR